MPDIQQSDVVGNYLGSLYQAQDRGMRQVDRQNQMQRQQVQDEQQAQQFQWTKEQHDLMAAADATSKELRMLKPGDKAGFDAAMQRLIAQGYMKPEDAAKYNYTMLPQLLEDDKKWQELQKFRQDQRLSEATLAHTQAATAALRAKPAGVAGVKAPSGYQYVIGEDGQPSLQFIPGGPADPSVKPLTDEQAKAAGFASRLRDADGRLASPEVSNALLSGYDNTVADIPLGIGNAMVTNEYQIGDQARRDFLNAQLRRESGAVIGTSEFGSGTKQYFPNYGDKEAVLMNKALARKQAIYNMFVSAGPRYAKDAEDARKEYIALRQKIVDGAKAKPNPQAAATTNHIDEADRIVGIKK